MKLPLDSLAWTLFGLALVIAGLLLLLRARREAAELESAKSVFVSLASHQLRTPATAVKHSINILRDGYAGRLTKKQKDYLRQANEANEHQLNIIENIILAAQIESGQLKYAPR